MEFGDWWSKQVTKEGGFKYQDSVGLHVIGTCGECEHWREEICNSQKVPFDVFGNTDIPEDFGCIHFAEQTPFEPKGKEKQ